jgi:hypothetical protein
MYARIQLGISESIKDGGRFIVRGRERSFGGETWGEGTVGDSFAKGVGKDVTSLHPTSSPLSPSPSPSLIESFFV